MCFHLGGDLLDDGTEAGDLGIIMVGGLDLVPLLHVTEELVCCDFMRVLSILPKYVGDNFCSLTLHGLVQGYDGNGVVLLVGSHFLPM